MNLADCRGDWALVTGATSGIGREFCVQLAAAGLNVAMVARRKQSMDDLASELRARHGVRTLVVDQDLAVPGAAAAVRERVARHDVVARLLVNSAAFGPWGRFENFPAEHYERLIQLVAVTPVSMCRVFHEDIRSFARSAIVNVSSPAALQPVPFMAAYASAKSCLHDFSLALHAEWKASGVLVQTLVPGPTRSESCAASAPAGRCALRNAVNWSSEAWGRTDR